MNKSMLSALAVVTLLVTAALAIPARAEGPELEIDAGGDFGMESFGTANDTANFDMMISNIGNGDYTDVSAVANFVEDGWEDGAVHFEDWDGNDGEGSISLGALNANEYTGLSIEAPVPSGANPGEMGTLEITVTADGDSQLVVFGIRIINWFAYNGDDVQSFNRGDTKQYDLEVFNVAVDENGGGREISEDITLNYVAVGSSWTVSFDEIDEFVDSIVLYGPHAAGSWSTIPVYVTLNDNVLAGSTTIDLQASSIDEDFNYYMQPPGFLALGADVAPYYGATMSGEGSQDATVDGGTLSWDFSVKNDGNVLDSFDLTWDTSGLPAGWSTDAADDSTDYLNMNEDYDDSVTLTIPVNQSAGKSGSFTLTVTSVEGDWSESFDFSASVAQSFGLTLEVAASEMTANPGDQAGFSFTVYNTGNGLDDYAITVQTLATIYNPSAPASIEGVKAGDPAPFALTATVPAGSAFPSSSGNITVTVTSSDGTTAASATVSVVTAQVFGLAWSYRTDENDTALDSASAEAGGANGTLGLVLTNTGNGADTATGFMLMNAPDWAELDDPGDKVLVAGGSVTVWVNLDPPGDAELGDDIFQVMATGGGGTATSGDLTATVVEKSTGGDDPDDIDTGEDEDKGWLPGFGLLAVFAALGAALLLRRRN